jgi:uracil-DNA glycosylase family 4
VSPAAPDPAWLMALADNLACRSRLGFSLVSGDLNDLKSLLAGAFPPPTTSPGSRGQEQGSLPASAAKPAAAQGALARVRAAMGECTRCPLHKGRQHIVFGKGAGNAELMFIGEGPGAEEDRRGEPFVGPAGRLLDRMLAAVGLKTSQVYITNIVKCRPPGNRDPQAEEVAACRPFLEEQVRAVGPKIICTLGKPAANALLGNQAPISALRGNWQRFMGVPLLPTFHPAYLLRSPERKGQAYQDLKALVQALGQGPPES